MIDWSSFWPDMIVALFTGVFVGVAVLSVERRLSGRAAARESFIAQSRVVEECERWVTTVYPDDHTSLMPDETYFEQVQSRVMEAGVDPSAETYVPFKVLRDYVNAWKAMRSSSFQLQRQLIEHPHRENVLKSLNRILVNPERKPTEGAQLFRASDFPPHSDSRLVIEAYVGDRTDVATFQRAFDAWQNSVRNAQFRNGSDFFDHPRNTRLQRWRAGRLLKKAGRHVRRDADLEAIRVLRTREAKKRHRIETLFGRENRVSLVEPAKSADTAR